MIAVRYDRGVSESFVDLAYRGLPLGRRIKLTQVRPSTGYLEMPAPMPVGTEIAISTDEGIALDAVVMHIHEQVGGSDRAPGMTVQPKLAAEAAATWWRARVALPEEDPVPTMRPRSVTVRPRSKTEEQPRPPIVAEPAEPPPPIATGRAQTIIGTGPQTITADEPPRHVQEQGVNSTGLVQTLSMTPRELVAEEPPAHVRDQGVNSTGLMQTLSMTPRELTADEPPAHVRTSRVDSSGLLQTLSADAPGFEPAHGASGEIVSNEHDGRTRIMPAVDQELLEELTRNPDELAQLTSTSGEHAVVDDGLRTTVMDAVDPAALGLEMTASGRFKTVIAEDAEPADSGPVSNDADDSGGDKPVTSGVKKRRKKR